MFLARNIEKINGEVTTSCNYKVIIGAALGIGVSAFLFHRYLKANEDDTYEITPVPTPSPGVTPDVNYPGLNNPVLVDTPNVNELVNPDVPNELNTNVVDVGHRWATSDVVVVTEPEKSEKEEQPQSIQSKLEAEDFSHDDIEIKVSSLDDNTREQQGEQIRKTLEEMGFKCEDLLGGWVLAKGNRELVETVEAAKTLKIVRYRI